MDIHKSNGLELADIFRQFSVEYQHRYTLCISQQKAFQAIKQCRTATLGMHVSKCDSCDHKTVSYNSCRNRHCPKCQYIKQLLWVDKLKSRLLPTRYFHIVFTVPDFLNALFYINQRRCYDMLFKASAMALQKVAGNPAFLGAQTGAVSVLHTWGQSLSYHPHIHCLVPAGGLDPDGQEWIHTSKKFFVPVKVLSKIFRAVFFGLLEKALKNNTLIIPEKENIFYKNLKTFKMRAYQNLWHIYVKKTFKGAGQVISYLGRYTHRVAISNNRLLSLADNLVSFRWKDYRDNRMKIMKLEVICFIRRFLQHILPCGYYKIRYYGIFASVHAKTSMNQCFALLTTTPAMAQYEGLSIPEVLGIVTGNDIMKCPKCKKGNMVIFIDPEPSPLSVT